MKFTSAFVALALSLTVSGKPMTNPHRRDTPTIYTCGDSTMARSKDGVTDGWGQYFGTYTTTTVVNKAIGGRSARSYTAEGRFDEVAELVVAGDIVVIEFGHNDGGTPEKNDNGRSDCPGAGEETCISDKDGSTVYTFVYYVSKAAQAFVAKGATVVLSSQTPNNPYSTGSFVYSPPRFVGYPKVVAEALGDPSVTWVDHFNAVALMDLKLGADVVTKHFPEDHVHTSPEAADLIAQAFAQAIATAMNGTTSLVDYIVSDYPRVY